MNIRVCYMTICYADIIRFNGLGRRQCVRMYEAPVYTLKRLKVLGMCHCVRGMKYLS